jgi:hypothetical protein
MPVPYVQSGGLLVVTQNGTVGPVTINGGSFNPFGDGNTGNLTLTPAATFIDIIDSAFPGQFGTAHVTGTVTLAGATLHIITPGNIPAGTQLLTIDNDSTDPIVGIFAGLPEGSIVTAGGEPFRITYVGGDGNDVVLTALDAAAIPMLDWRMLVLLAVAIAAIALRR